MTTLANFPLVSQLTPITSDGRPSENAQFDCVPASIGAGLLWYAGKTQWDAEINPDKLKDAVYGESVQNQGTAASAYISFCKSLGYDLWAFKGIPGVLVSEAHKQLQAGHPVIFTEPDPYVSASLGWTHVCVFYGETPGGLVALDPYIAKPISRTDAEWEQLLLDNAIWILEKEDAMPQPLDISMPAVAALFIEEDAQRWRSKKTGKVLQFGLLADYKAHGQASLDYLGDIVSNEIPMGPGIVRQHHEMGVRLWSNGKASSLPLYSGPGQDPLITKLQAQIVALQSQPAMPQLQATALQAAEELASAVGKKLV